MSIIGIDCGASKIEFILCLPDQITNPQQTFRVATPKTDDYDNFVNILKDGIAKLAQASSTPIMKIGIGVPGRVNPSDKIIKKSSIRAIKNKNLAQDITRLTNIKTDVANDAKCFALSEAVLGAGSEYNNVVGLIVGTGAALGYVQNKKLFLGANGLAGEIGHWMLSPSGAMCWCGNRGCMETIISGKALERIYFEKTATKKKVHDIHELYLKKNPLALIVTRTYLEYFGFGLAQIVNLLDPDVIVLGGGVSNLPLLYDEGVNYIKKYVFSDYFQTPLVKNKLGDSSGVFGACLL